MQLHVHVCQQSHIQTSNYSVMDSTIEKSWSKSDITLSFLITQVLLFFCLQKKKERKDFISIKSRDLDI